MAPALAFAFLGSASALGLGGCFGKAVTLANDVSPNTGAVDAANDEELQDGGPDEPEKQDATPDPLPHVGEGMTVDGTACTGVTAKVTTQSAPDGRTWILNLKGTCGALGVVDAFITGKDNVGYPQSCASTAFVRASIGGQGDAGWLAYDSSDTRGSCTVQSGPSVANPSTSVSINAVVESASGETHTLSYSSSIPPKSSLTIDNIPCTGVTRSVTTQSAPDGKTWFTSLKGTCGSLSTVDVFVASKDDLNYPQSCSTSTRVQLLIDAEADAGGGYTSDPPAGSCTITSGPSAANQQSPVAVTATVGGTGKTHVIVITP